MNSRYPLHSTPICLALAATLIVSALPARAQENTPDTEDAKILYVLGMLTARNLAVLDLTADELETVQQGLKDSILKRDPKVDPQEYAPKIQAFAQQRIAAVAQVEKDASAAFLKEEANKPGAVMTDSGLVIAEITPGDGASPSATDKVTVHYHGTLRDGTVFDSSVDRGEPATFGLNQVIPCWTEGLQQIKVGGKSRLTCPSAIAYGDQGRAPLIKGGAVLIFEVELLGIDGG